jgi:arsenic resistance protein ArsH
MKPGRMKPSSYYDRIVDVMEELVRFTVLMRPLCCAACRSLLRTQASRLPVDPATDLSGIALRQTTR